MKKDNLQHQEDSSNRKWGNYHSKTTAANQDNEFVSDFFGIERKHSERAIMLDIQLQSGRHKAIPYTYLSDIDYNPSGEIIIEFMERKVTISGRNLEKLYEYLLLHRVNYVKENVGDLDDTPENQLFIESIKLEKVTNAMN